MNDIWQAIMADARPMPRISPVTGRPQAYRTAGDLARGCVRQSIVRQERAEAAQRGALRATKKTV